jgi:hypothetical protein
MSTDYRKTMWAEMSPDMYDGDTCDQVRPRWHEFCGGDVDLDYSDTLKLAAKNFPPGTMMLILEPECPKCHQIPEICHGDECCDFDWDSWVADRYS